MGRSGGANHPGSGRFSGGMVCSMTQSECHRVPAGWVFRPSTNPISPKTMLPSRLLFPLALFGTGTLQASTLHWNTPDSDSTAGTVAVVNWTDGANWSTDAAGLLPSTLAPGSADDAVFNSTPQNALSTAIRVNTAGISANSLTFNSTGTTNITGTGNQQLTVYGGGLTSNAGAGAVTFGTSAANRNISVRFQENQTWTNNSATTVNIRNNAAGADTATADVAVTFRTTSTGQITNSGGFSDGASGFSLALAVDSSGTGAVSINGGTYSGGTTVKRGLLIQNGTSQLGTGAVTLGNTSGGETAALRLNTSTIQTTALNVQSGNTGANQLQFSASSAGGWDGDIQLDNALSVQVRGSNTTAISGDVTGSGSFSKDAYAPSVGNGGTLAVSGNLTYTGNTTINAGVFQLASAASMTFFIGADGVNNTLNGTATVALDGTFIFNLTNAVALDGNSWQIVDVDGLSESYGPNFNVAGFTGDNGVWTSGGYTFTEADGVLTFVIPEPGSALLAAGGVLLLGLRRRRGV
ncbi:MAG: hypothetical protein EOP87_04710 [Verrucomicrobiaceae bacterium]|nr:MAG: hypothetical protein EOP87_04710 [Verrucomicrobiaceae bacterium]